MKSVLCIHNIEIKWYSLIYFSVYLLSPYAKSLFFIFIVLTIHELGHYLCARALNMKVSNLIIYPFGIGMHIENLDYVSSYKEFLVAIGGPLTFYLTYFIFLQIYSLKMISYVEFSWIQSINTNVLIFNLLPIYPLDGGRLLRSLIHKCFTYKFSEKLILSFSIIILFCLVYYDLSKFFIYFLLLIIMLLIEIKHFKKKMYGFYMYRYLNDLKLPKRHNYHHDLYRNYYNYFMINHHIISELQFIENYLNISYDKHTKPSNFMI